MKAKALLSIFFSLVMGATAYSSIVAGVDSSLWVGTPAPTKTLMQENVTSNSDDKYCNKHTEQRVKYTPSTSGWKFVGLDDIVGCWYQTGYGVFGTDSQGAYLRMAKNGAVIMIDNPFYHNLIPAGDGNKLIGVYTVGSQRNMYMYEDVSQAFYKQPGYYDKYITKPDAAKWRLNDPATGQALPMMRVASSQNGQWLIVEATNGFMRINTSTKEMMTFESVLYRYGFGQDPTYELSISNDGRYAAIGGGNVVERQNIIYDLSSCLPVGGKPLELSVGCGKRNLKADVFPQLAKDQAVQRVIFSDNGENITIDAPLANQWNRYLVTAYGKEGHGLDYLALGDSYSSGEGEYDSSYYMKGTDGDGANEPGFQVSVNEFPYGTEKCHLSSRSHPYLLSGQSNISATNFHSVACSGAKMDDVLGRLKSRYDGNNGFLSGDKIKDTDLSAIQSNALIDFIPGRAAQIEFVKKYKPRVATIGIGGNDIGFSDKVKDCVNVGTCAYVNDLRQYTGLEIHALYKKLVDTYQQLHDASPTTRFYVVGYPDVISDDNICAPNVRLNTDERYYAKQVITYLDTVIKASAQTVGFTYLDIKDSLVGDRLCDFSFDGKAVQGLVGGNDQGGTVDIFGNQVDMSFIGNESFHPTDIGHQRIANTIAATFGGDTIVSHNPCVPQNVVICPTTPESIEIPSYFLPHPLTAQGIRRIQLEAAERVSTSSFGYYPQGATMQPNNAIDSQGQPINDLLPNSAVSASIYSDERVLAPLNVDPDGHLTGLVTIPQDITPGQHTIVLKVKNNLYQDIVLYQPIIVYSSLEDIDGDGIPNAQDHCTFIEPAGVDADQDGVDDGCDGIIYRAPDTTAPVVKPVVEAQPNEKGWYKNNVTIHWSVSDNVDSNLVTPADITADQEGEHVYTSPQVCDASGNCAAGSVTIRLDSTPPTITVETDSQPNTKGWYNHPVTLSWQVSDNLTTLATPTVIQVRDEGEHTYATGQICDDAGNCATGSTTIRLDMTAPTVTATLERSPNSEGWYNSPVRIDWAASDNLDSSISAPASIIADKQGEYVYTTGPQCDIADNCTTGSQPVHLDSAAPIVSELTWSINPKKTAEVSELSVDIQDTTSGLRRAEYFVGDNDPGVGRGAVMQYDGTRARVTNGIDYPAGVYKLSVRAQDAAGNWSLTSRGYLVVYDPSSDIRVRGKKVITLTPAMHLPYVVVDTTATFGLSAQYNKDQTIAKQSDFQLTYKTGSRCKDRENTTNCHNVELNTTSIQWLVIDGINQSRAILQASAVLTIDGRGEPVVVRIEALDGTKLDQISSDKLMVSIYRSADPFSVPASIVVGPVNVERGNIKVGR